MQKKNIKTVAVICAAVPVIAITMFIMSRINKDDAPGLYISDSAASAAAQENEDNKQGDIDDPNKNRKDPNDNKIEDPTEDNDPKGGNDSKDPDNTENSAASAENNNGGKSGGEADDKPNTKDSVSKSSSDKDSSNADSKKDSSSGSKTDTSSKKGGDSSSKKDSSSSSASSGRTSSSKAPAKSDSSAAAKDTTSKAPESEEPIPKEDVKYTFDTLDKMVDHNFSISTSGHINYMVNANVSGAAEYNGSDTHIKVDSPDFPAVNSDTYTQGGQTYRVVSPENATYSHNPSLAASFIDFGRLFERFAAQRDYLIPLECKTEGGVTTEKFSFTYYDELNYYDYVTLIITIQYDASGTPFSLHVTTNEDYGYEEIYQSDSLSFSESNGGVNVPDFSGWTCVDTPSA